MNPLKALAGLDSEQIGAALRWRDDGKDHLEYIEVLRRREYELNVHVPDEELAGKSGKARGSVLKKYEDRALEEAMFRELILHKQTCIGCSKTILEKVRELR